MSIKEIAKIAGVSSTTVSFVLNNRGGEFGISESTRERIMEVVRQHNYRQNIHGTGKPGHLQKEFIESLAVILVGKNRKILEDPPEGDLICDMFHSSTSSQRCMEHTMEDTTKRERKNDPGARVIFLLILPSPGYGQRPYSNR